MAPNDNRFSRKIMRFSFFIMNFGLQDTKPPPCPLHLTKIMRFSLYSLFCEKLHFSNNRDNHGAIIAISWFALRLSTALCSLYGLCPLYGALLPLQPSVSSTPLCPLYSPLLTILPCILSVGLCFHNSPLSPLQLSVPSIAPCPLYGPMSLYRYLSPLYVYL
jgi:hypothetical protein